jgi:maleylpyruvate isomerase
MPSARRRRSPTSASYRRVSNARRFGVDLAPFPRLAAADAAARRHPAFAGAAPERQPDAE